MSVYNVSIAILLASGAVMSTLTWPFLPSNLFKIEQFFFVSFFLFISTCESGQVWMLKAFGRQMQYTYTYIHTYGHIKGPTYAVTKYWFELKKSFCLHRNNGKTEPKLRVHTYSTYTNLHIYSGQKCRRWVHSKHLTLKLWSETIFNYFTSEA